PGLWPLPRADYLLRGKTMADAIRITKTTRGKKKPKDKDLAFGNVFTDHMFVADFQEEKGWYDPRVEPYAPFALDPATAVLHYGQSLFEGLKAFRGRDGTIRLFRPQKHVERLNRTAARMTIPHLDPELILHSWTTLVDVDRDWVPSSVGTSLYIRPTIIASEPFLGVRPAKRYLYYVILSPVGPYYPEGLAPTKIKVIDNYVRAVAGGLGEAKTAANYAASLYAAEEAKHEGFTQVLWLDGVQHKYIEEVGTSNIMLRIGDEVITPPLSWTILAGVTRDTALTLMRGWGVRVAERPSTIDEAVAAAENGTLREVWATASCPISRPYISTCSGAPCRGRCGWRCSGIQPISPSNGCGASGRRPRGCSAGSCRRCRSAPPISSTPRWRRSPAARSTRCTPSAIR